MIGDSPSRGSGRGRGGGLVALRFALEIGLCAVLCPDIFGWLLTVVILFYAGAIMLGLDGVSLLFTGRTFGQSRSALGHSIDRLNRGR